MVSPMLKFYAGQPIMINENIDVTNCIANGAEGVFLGVVFMPGVDFADLDIITIDGYRGCLLRNCTPDRITNDSNERRFESWYSTIRG